jgi:hypothetical protein
MDLRLIRLLTIAIPVNQSTMAYNGAVPHAGVWVKLYYKGQEEAIGDAIEIKPIPENVNDLNIAVFPDRSPVQIAAVKVYAPCTDIPGPDSTDHLRPGIKLLLSNN